VLLTSRRHGHPWRRWERVTRGCTANQWRAKGAAARQGLAKPSREDLPRAEGGGQREVSGLSPPPGKGKKKPSAEDSFWMRMPCGHKEPLSPLGPASRKPGEKRGLHA
jgi:hypothetical protein